MGEELRPLAQMIARGIRNKRAAREAGRKVIAEDREALDIMGDLKRWQTKSLKALKEGRKAAVPFRSDSIPPALSKAVQALLIDAVTPEHVREAFKASASTTNPTTTHTTATVVGGGAAVGFQAEFDKLTVEFTKELTQLAGQLGSGSISVDEFTTRMAAEIRTAYTQAYQLGASVQQVAASELTAADRATITDYISDEIEYLNGFERALQLQHVPDTEAYLIGRVTLYADAIYGLYWEGRTSRVTDDYDVYYQSEDDANTCLPCQLNEVRSPYSPEDAPIPGNDCEGRSRCRCTLRYVYRQESQIAANAQSTLTKTQE